MTNKKIFLTSITIFTILTIFAITPSIISVFGVSGNTTTFNVTLTVTTGTPSITYIDTVSDSPNEGTSKQIILYFNATHPNGVSSIPASGANMSINQSGVTIWASTCSVNSTSGITNRYQCNLTLNYYNLPGTWTINATIVDQAANRQSNLSSGYTNGNTYGVAVTQTSLSFSGSPGQTVQPSTQQIVNNTGNMAYTQINLTAFDIRSGSSVIDARNFTANTTGTGTPGQQLINNTIVAIPNSSISVQATRDLNISLTIPSGTTNGTYTSVASWIVNLVG